jgi:hypothetical protein
MRSSSAAKVQYSRPCRGVTRVSPLGTTHLHEGASPLRMKVDAYNIVMNTDFAGSGALASGEDLDRARMYRVPCPDIGKQIPRDKVPSRIASNKGPRVRRYLHGAPQNGRHLSLAPPPYFTTLQPHICSSLLFRLWEGELLTPVSLARARTPHGTTQRSSAPLACASQAGTGRYNPAVDIGNEQSTVAESRIVLDCASCQAGSLSDGPLSDPHLQNCRFFCSPYRLVCLVIIPCSH